MQPQTPRARGNRRAVRRAVGILIRGTQLGLLVLGAAALLSR